MLLVGLQCVKCLNVHAGLFVALCVTPWACSLFTTVVQLSASPVWILDSVSYLVVFSFNLLLCSTAQYVVLSIFFMM